MRTKKKGTAAWHKKAFVAFTKLRDRNQLHRVFTIKRDYMPNMFGALKPWSGEPDDMIGVAIQGDVMHFYQLLKYENAEDGHQTLVPALDDVSNVVFSDDSPESLYQDAIDAVLKVGRAKQIKPLLQTESEGFEELLPSAGQAWKPVIVTRAEDGGILFYELTDQVQKVKRTHKAKQVAGNADGSNDDLVDVKEPAV